MELRKRCGHANPQTKPATCLQPLLGLLLALDRKHKGVRARLSDLQLMLLLFAVLRDVGDGAALEQQFHLRLLVLGTLIALHLTRQTTVRA